MNSLTPMMQQYLSIKAAHNEHLLFYRLGDFYELFFSDAEIASEVLDIVLTKRGKHFNSDIPMCGVPYHSSVQYMNKLLKRGYSIAICEQIETPEEAKKRGYKSVVRREVVQIITPGTLTEEELLDSKGVNYLASMSIHKSDASIAWVDISTGEFYVMKYGENEIINEVLKLSPKEILISEKDNEVINTIKKEGKIHITSRSDNLFDCNSTEAKLRDYYKIHSLKSIGEFDITDVIAAGVLIEYVIHTQKNNIPRLKKLKKLKRNLFLEIDIATKLNLEIDDNKKFSLLKIIDETITAPGGRLLKQRLNMPLCDLELINKRLDCVDFFYFNDEVSDKLRNYLKYFPDIQRSLSKIAGKKSEIKDLYAIKNGLTAASMIAELFRTYNVKLNNEINSIISSMFGYSELLEMLNNVLIPDFQNHEFIRNGYNKALDELYEFKNNSSNQLNDLVTKYKMLTSVNNLKINHNNILGYFVEVSNHYANKITQSIFIHKQTLGNSVRYFTDELKHIEDLIINCNNKIISLEKEIFENICNQIEKYFDEINIIVEAVANLDFYSTLGKIAKERDYVRPNLNNTTDIIIKEGRHPVVERLQKETFIANSLEINKNHSLLLLTGPNMAGKSTFLRQNALICILAQIGSYVPAKEASIGVVDKIFSRIGASDNIAKGESTFLVEMNETAYILNNATEKSFVILDEIGRGTSTYDGMAIAWSVIEYLHNHIKSRTVFATHYHELTKLEKNLNGVKNYTMSVKEWNGDIIFMHKVVSGVALGSYGIHVAKLAGVPSVVIDKAKKILADFSENAHFETVASQISEIKNIDRITPIKAYELIQNLKNYLK